MGDKKQQVAQAVDTSMNVNGNAAGVVGTGLDIASEAGHTLGNVGTNVQGVSGALGLITGSYGMGKAGADMYQNGVGLQNSADMAFNGAGTYAGAATLMGSSGPAAPLAGAAARGYGVGGPINSAAGSDYAKQEPGGVGGTHQTYADWWLDTGAEIGGATGMAVGVGGATFGTIADACVAAYNWLFD